MKFFHKIIAMTMAFLMLVSTTSFAVSMHYCGKTLVNFSVLKTADSCGMEKTQPEKKTSTCSFQKKGCCSDKQVSVDGQDEANPSFQPDFQQQLFVATFFYFYINLFEGLDQQIIPFKHYSPPPLIQDIQLLDETFLI